MMNKNIFKEIMVLDSDVYEDYRGELWTTYNKDNFPIDLDFNHDKISTSRKNVIRGIHGDNKSWKLVTCLYGDMYFVVVDNRKDSKTYLQWDWIILNDRNKKMVLLPPNFGNSFCVLSNYSIFMYKWSYTGDYADVEEQFSLKWDNPDININWPITNTPIERQ